MILFFSILSIILTILVINKKINPIIRDSSLVGTLVSTAVLGRLSMVHIPNVQPVTFLIITAGYIYGCGVGFLTGILTAIISNFALGQGPWTIWQAVAWGLAGAAGGILKMFMENPKKSSLVALAFGWGYVFGAIMDTMGWILFMPVHTLSTYFAVFASSFAFNTAHAVGNGLLMFILGVPLINIITKFRCSIYGLEHPLKTPK